MSFNADTKARMFIKSARLCCLCLKQCGTNIEAAHIHDESKGGSNDESNGIPLCFDCHQEIGGYDPKHPKGNKFSHDELRARRDRVYKLVDTGVIFSQLVASKAHASGAGSSTAIPANAVPAAASVEAKKLFEMMLKDKDAGTKFAGKIKLLSPEDRAHILDELATSAPTNARAVEILLEIATSKLVTGEESKVVIERTVRHVTLYGTTESKAAMLSGLPPQSLLDASEELREALFDEAIDTITSDQFNDVNALVPSLESHLAAVPPRLHFDFVLAILDQSRSRSHQGAPAANRMLKALPSDLARTAIQSINGTQLCNAAGRREMKAFVTAYKHLASGAQTQMLDDFCNNTEMTFAQEYVPDEE